MAIHDIADLIAPGCDGFNAHFFKTTWTTAKSDISEAVMQFFKTNLIYKAINCTSVTLVSKVQNPSSIKEFRPISCCTILYKIIFELLTKRLQTVMDNLVDHGEAAFAPGRVITNNILLSHELVKGYTRKGISPRCMLKIDMQKAYNYI